MNIVFILSQFVYILFFSSLITLARTYSMTVDRICERGQPCIAPDFGGGSIQFYNTHACVRNRFSHVWLFVILWTVAVQTPLSMGLSRQASWQAPGKLWPPLGDLPDWDQTWVSCIGGWILYHWYHLGSPLTLLGIAFCRYSSSSWGSSSLLLLSYWEFLFYFFKHEWVFDFFIFFCMSIDRIK